LFYRINVFPIHIPPLRDRIADIRLLADYCLEKYRRKLNSQVAGFSEEALQILCGYDYPGNVRELENLIERALILSTGPRIEAGEWLPVLPISTSGMTRLEHLERAEIERLLERHQGNLILVARELGISRTTLWRRLKDYRLQSDQDARVSQ
jgi:transcriptional regulator with PAS, ATPase and Fis domain